MKTQDDKENNGSCEKGPCSSKLKLKLNLWKLKKDKDESRGDEDVNNVREEKNLLVKQKKDHICCECGKEFSSGKALGGHMSSAHVQANQRIEESWKKKKNFIQEKSSKLIKRRFDDDDEQVVFEEEEEIGDGVFDEIICEICKKSFPSKKSLFGHMRCHPDRDWRGMKPPSKKIAKNKGFQANFHDEDMDVNEDEDEDRFASIRDEEEVGGIHVNVVVPPLKDWGAKDRRGRSPLAKKRSFSCIDSDDDKDLHDAVQQLIRLVNGDDNNNNNNDNSSEVMMCSSNSVGSAPKEAPLSDLKDKSKRKVVVDKENREETCLDSQVHKKRKREKELIKLEPVQDPVLKKSPEVKHKCNVCGKIFASHQALGGHRSSHNKFKISIENTIDHQGQEIKARSQEDNNTQDYGHQDVVRLGNQEINNCNIIINDNNNNNNVHKCKFCDKIFSTVRALGGHQRSHMTNNQEEEEESSSQIASKVLDFDLNELPDLDDNQLF